MEKVRTVGEGREVEGGEGENSRGGEGKVRTVVEGGDGRTEVKRGVGREDEVKRGVGREDEVKGGERRGVKGR